MSEKNSHPRLSPSIRRRLLAAAKHARPHALATFTRYQVGAAVLGGSGRIYPGVNVESPTAIGHICAEQNAIFSSITHGEREILAVAVASKDSEPCGGCRQMILEFGKGDVPIFALHQGSAGAKETLVETTISQLMPLSHTADKLGFEALTTRCP